MGGGEEHVVGHLAGLRDDGSETHPRKDEDIVRLTDHTDARGAGDVAARTAGGDERPPFRPREDVLRPRLGTGARVRQRKHDRDRVVEPDFSDEGLGERACASRCADEDRCPARAGDGDRIHESRRSEPGLEQTSRICRKPPLIIR